MRRQDKLKNIHRLNEKLNESLSLKHGNNNVNDITADVEEQFNKLLSQAYDYFDTQIKFKSEEEMLGFMRKVFTETLDGYLSKYKDTMTYDQHDGERHGY